MDDQVSVAEYVWVTSMLVDGVVVTRAAGEIDINSVDTVGVEVSKQLDQRPSALVVDLNEVTFLGSAGIGMLMEEQQHALECGAAFVVVADQRAVLRTLDVTGVRNLFVVFPTVHAAIHTLHGSTGVCP